LKPLSSTARAFLGSAALLTSFLPIRRLNLAAAAMPDDRHPHWSLEVVGGGSRESEYCIGWNRHAETIFVAFFRSLPNVRFRRECLRTKDNGSVALDWVSGDDFRLPPDSSLLILLVSVPDSSLSTQKQLETQDSVWIW
ncbi:hypothetical protein HYC85_004062, partial [Camellia sinensis]